MIHTVHLDDECINVKEFQNEIHRQKQGARFENSASDNVAPEGYITSEEFRRLAIIKVNKFCKKHGIL